MMSETHDELTKQLLILYRASYRIICKTKQQSKNETAEVGKKITALNNKNAQIPK